MAGFSGPAINGGLYTRTEMPSKIYGPRKRRTREHVIADQSVHFVEGFILAEGHTADKLIRDYGYDLVMTTFDEAGFIEPGFVFFQVKATAKRKVVDAHVVFDIDVRDYHLWLFEKHPVILILYDAAEACAHWMSIKEYFSDVGNRPKRGAKWVRIHIPVSNCVNRQAIAAMRDAKNHANLTA